MNTLIVIPARYGSTRLPGKPLAMIAGQSLLRRVVRLAQVAAGSNPSIRITVATDDERITAHARDIGVDCAMTSASCPTGTDRVREAMEKTDFAADFVINLQGDAPLTPPDFLTAMIASFQKEPCDLITPVTQMSWEQLDKLRADKRVTPFSGTTVAFNEKDGLAYWFSKNILPAVRKEDELRTQNLLSPVWRHIGLYGYSRAMLEKFSALSEGVFEKLEGLEQLRVIENGYKIRCVPVDYRGRASMSGIDSPEDIIRAETLIAKHGELV